MSDMGIYRQPTARNKNAGRRFCGLFAGEYQEDDPRVGCELLDPLFPLGLWKLAKVAAVRLSMSDMAMYRWLKVGSIVTSTEKRKASGTPEACFIYQLEL